MNPKHLPFTSQDVVLLKEDNLAQGFFTLVRQHIKHRLFNGEWSSEFTRELLKRKSAVAVLLYDPDLDRVLLIQQFRAGAIGRLATPWLLEIVAGVYDETENLDAVAKRESAEEAGCMIKALHPICEYFVSPGGSNEYLHLYIGHIDASHAGGIYGLPEEHEDIHAFTLTTDEALNWLKEGRINTSPAIIALLWLQLNREGLRNLWQKPLVK